MNPALMNYLQSQQTTPEQQNPQIKAQYNPFDAGIGRAIASAQESLGMTEKQQDKALRRSMLTFADNIAMQPKQRGFFNNFGSAAKALSPAIMEHDQYEDQAVSQNQAMANQILAHRAAEESKQNALEQQAWAREHAENQLGEQKRYHDMMLDYRQQKLRSLPQSSGVDLGADLGGKFTPIETAAEINLYAKDKKALGTVLHEISELEKNYLKFRMDYSKNLVDPMSPYSGIVNPVKDYFGKFASNKTLRQETADRKTLDSQLNKFVVSSERALKGGGVMGPKLIELFKEQGIYPDLKHDTPEVFESKLNMLKNELTNAYKASNLSLQHGVRIDPYEVKEFESVMNLPSQEEINPPGDRLSQSLNEFVPMQNSEGIIRKIPANRVNEALRDGLKIFNKD